MNLRIDDHVVLVTGAAGGIGLATCLELLQSGARVVAHYNRKAGDLLNLNNQYADQLQLVRADLSQPSQVSGLMRTVFEQNQRVHSIVNNAAVANPNALTNPSEEEWWSNWRHTMAVNVNAPAFLIRHLVPHFLETGGGRIVNISSRAAHRGDTAEYFDYAVSKSALNSMAQTIARNFGKNDIYAFNLAPGFVHTPMAQDFINTYGEEHVLSDLATNRLTEPADLSALILLLLSGRLDHATGSTFDINAGSYVR